MTTEPRPGRILRKRRTAPGPSLSVPRRKS
jgi:hypothetical protein